MKIPMFTVGKVQLLLKTVKMVCSQRAGSVDSQYLCSLTTECRVQMRVLIAYPTNLYSKAAKYLNSNAFMSTLQPPHLIAGYDEDRF